MQSIHLSGAPHNPAAMSPSADGGGNLPPEPLFENNPIFRRRFAQQKAFLRDGTNPPLIGGKLPSQRLLRIIPSSRYHKISPEMWENMQLMEDTRHLWSYDGRLESDPFLEGQPLVRGFLPKKRINNAVGFNLRPDDPSIHTQ